MRKTAATSGRTPPRKTSITTSRTRLLRDDHRELTRLAAELQKAEGTVLRELVHEALRARRLRKAGRDEITAPVRDAQREIVRGELADVKRDVKDLLDLQERIFGMLEDLEHVLTPLVFELVFEAWTDGRMSREILLKYLLVPALDAAGREVRGLEELRSEVVARAQVVSRRKVAEFRETILERPLESRRYAVE